MSFRYPKHVRFSCVRCALCCGDAEGRTRLILLLKSEADHISETASMGPDEIAEKIEGFEPYVYQMRKTNDGKCVFLKDNSCSIYQMRPLICRFYPFQIDNIGNNRYDFTYTDKCPGIGKGPQLKKNFFERLFDEFMESMRKNIAHM